MSNLSLESVLGSLAMWAEIYDFSFQFWGEGNNNAFIEKDDVELASFGGENSPEYILRLTLDWVIMHNPKGFPNHYKEKQP